MTTHDTTLAANAGTGARALDGRTALVTGSTAGLGLELALALATAGCNVLLHGLEPVQTMQSLCDERSDSLGVTIRYALADISNLGGVEKLVAAATEHWGGVDILVNNAVVRHFAPIVDFPVAQWEAALAVNLSAAFHAIRLLLPGMRARNFGRIFNMTSVYGVRGAPNRVDYAATKSALLGLTRTVALENLRYNITCHSVVPGSVLTPGTEARISRMQTEDGLSREHAERMFLEGKQPGGEFIPAQHVADLLVYLCGPHARSMTGAILPVEGGWLAS